MTELATTTTQTDWEARGHDIVRTVSNAAWNIGDWVNEAKGEWGDRYTLATTITGMPVKTLQNYAYIAERFPVRTGNLTFGHHQLVAWIPKEPAHQWLKLAATQQWSVRELQHALRSVRQLPPGQPEIVATIFKLIVPHDHHDKWKAAADHRQLTVEDWLINVADEAASTTPTHA